MAYKCIRETLVNYYCSVCLNLVATGEAELVYIHKDTNVFFVNPLYFIVCPHCGHYEQLKKDEFGYYFKECKVIKE